MGQIPTTPAIIPVPFAANGQKNSIPETVDTPGAPNASWSAGFPSITMINRQAGGKPPLGMDFNGVLNQLSNNAFFAQSGGLYPWDAALDYLTNAHVQGSDGEEYIAVAPSGPDVPAAGSGFVGAQDPTADTVNAYWISASAKFGAPIATQSVRGIARLATTAEVRAGAAAAGSPAPAMVRVDDVKNACYELCEVYYFLNPALRQGFVQAAGGLISNAATTYPAAFAYLQTSEGSALCVTESEWQAMSTAIYYTNAEGVSEGWNGVGGVPKFVVNTANGTIRVPDLRGMYMEAAGLDGLAVGGVHHDRMRNITGDSGPETGYGAIPVYTGNYHGALFTSALYQTRSASSGTGFSYATLHLDPSRVVPTGAHVSPRAWGSLACVYLGS